VKSLYLAIICFILLSCNSSDSEIKRTIIDPNDTSEMALLMRQMSDDLDIIKNKILNGEDIIGDQLQFSQIHKMKTTDESFLFEGLTQMSIGFDLLVNNFNENPLKKIRRKVLANPLDFVEKLNICDQVSQPVFYENSYDYNSVELSNIITNWNCWFKTINCDLELESLRWYWAERTINNGLSIESAAKYMGLTYDQFIKIYKEF